MRSVTSKNCKNPKHLETQNIAVITLKVKQIIFNVDSVLTRKAPNTTIAKLANTVFQMRRLIMSRLIWIYSVCPLVFDFSTL